MAPPTIHLFPEQEITLDDGRVMTGCRRFYWPGSYHVTDDLAAVTCGNCRRSSTFRSRANPPTVHFHFKSAGGYIYAACGKSYDSAYYATHPRLVSDDTASVTCGSCLRSRVYRNAVAAQQERE